MAPCYRYGPLRAVRAAGSQRAAVAHPVAHSHVIRPYRNVTIRNRPPLIIIRNVAISSLPSVCARGPSATAHAFPASPAMFYAYYGDVDTRGAGTVSWYSTRDAGVLGTARTLTGSVALLNWVSTVVCLRDLLLRTLNCAPFTQSSPAIADASPYHRTNERCVWALRLSLPPGRRWGTTAPRPTSATLSRCVRAPVHECRVAQGPAAAFVAPRAHMWLQLAQQQRPTSCPISVRPVRHRRYPSIASWACFSATVPPRTVFADRRYSCVEVVDTQTYRTYCGAAGHIAACRCRSPHSHVLELLPVTSHAKRHVPRVRTVAYHAAGPGKRCGRQGLPVLPVRQAGVDHGQRLGGR